MPRVEWPLRHGRPCLQIVLTLAAGSLPFPRMLLADTGAGSQTSGIDLILDEQDCLLCGGLTGALVAFSTASITETLAIPQSFALSLDLIAFLITPHARSSTLANLLEDQA